MRDRLRSVLLPSLQLAGAGLPVDRKKRRLGHGGTAEKNCEPSQAPAMRFAPTFCAKIKHILRRPTTARSISSMLYWLGVASRADRCSKTIGLLSLSEH